jgi:hypothetical protein
MHPSALLYDGEQWPEHRLGHLGKLVVQGIVLTEGELIVGVSVIAAVMVRALPRLAGCRQRISAVLTRSLGICQGALRVQVERLVQPLPVAGQEVLQVGLGITERW